VDIKVGGNMKTNIDDLTITQQPLFSINLSYSTNRLHLFKTMVKQLSEVSTIPIKIVCDSKDRYVLRQAIYDVSTNLQVMFDDECSTNEPSIIISY